MTLPKQLLYVTRDRVICRPSRTLVYENLRKNDWPIMLIILPIIPCCGAHKIYLIAMLKKVMLKIMLKNKNYA